MYIAKLEVKNYRNLLNSTIEFNDGVNVIIGPNNSGKTNILSALGLIFDRTRSQRLTIADFSRQITDFSEPPTIIISATIKESSTPSNEKADDANVVSTWLENLDPPYNAKLTYRFFLPDTEVAQYEKEYSKLKLENPGVDDYWRLIKKKFIRKYVARTYGGDPDLGNRADREFLEKFDFQFLDAVRDVERHMFSGKNPLLREILDYFLDDDVKSNDKLLPDKQETIIEEKEQKFYQDSRTIIGSLRERINLEAILEYSKETGASIGGTPKFEGEISEADLLSSLQLVITTMTGIDIPATHNGLGYNNLIHMALLLAKMQMDCSSYVGQENAKVFPMLVIEEPEAHLHPSMQFKFLKFLRNNIASAKQVRQLFVTTHSTHITAAVKLDEIICLYHDEADALRVAYPGKVFDPAEPGDMASKNYIERFLDATKSDMLFASKVIFVEGIAEQLLLPCLSLYKDVSFQDEHVSIINVGGRYFHHFLKLFNYDENNDYKQNAIGKRVACVIDADPTKKLNGRWKKCYPFEVVAASVDCRCVSGVVENLKSSVSNNISVFCNESGKGKTLEFDLAFDNPECNLLVTPCLIEKHRKKLAKLIAVYPESNFETLKSETPIDSELLQSIEQSDWTNDEKKRALVAAYYLTAVESVKGEHALQLADNLSTNLTGKKPTLFKLPKNIENAITWISE